MLLKIDENSPNRSGKTSSGKHAHGAVAGLLSFVALQSLFPATTAAIAWIETLNNFPTKQWMQTRT